MEQQETQEDVPFLQDLASLTLSSPVDVHPSLFNQITPGAHFIINQQRYDVALDTACTPLSCIDLSVADKLGLEIQPQQGIITLGNGSQIPRRGLTSPLTFEILFTGLHNPLPRRTFTHRFEVVQGLSATHNHVAFLMGTDLLREYCGTIQRESAPDFLSALLGLELCFGNDVPSSKALRNNAPASETSGTISVLRLVMEESIFQDDDLAPMKPQLTSSDEDNERYQPHRESILNDLRVQEGWNTNESIVGGITHPEAVVKLKFKEGINLQSLSRHQYPVPHKAVAFVDQATNDWHGEGKDEVVTTNPGPIINVPLLAVPKVSGGLVVPDAARVCCDPRIPNEALDYVDDFQLPLIRQQLESLGGKKFFAEFDLENCFFQCPIHPDTRYLAYTWRGIQYRFTHTPFGIKFITSHVQRFMSKIFADLGFVSVYVDNLFVASSSWDEHRDHILAVLQRCNQHHIKLKRKAFKLGETKMYTLGHIVSREGISADPNKVKAVLDWPAPTTGEGLQSFLGTTGFIRMFMRHYSELAAPLEAVKYHKTIEWNDLLREHFDALKKAVAAAPFLAYPDFSKPFYVQTDSSNFGCGAVLYQPEPGHDEITSDNIVALVSKHFKDTQRNYSAYKKELFGVVFALRQFHSYLAFRADNHLFTDHKPLTFMFSSDNLSPGLQMWLDILLSYNFTIHHRPGFLNVLPDALSRAYTTKYQGRPWGVPSNIRFVEPEESPLPPVHQSLMANSIGTKGPDSLTPTTALAVEMELRGKKIPATESERAALIQQEHSLGHFGRDAICNALLEQDHWWPGMRLQVQAEVSRCNACMRFVVGKKGFKPAEYILSNGPWSHVQMDLCLSFPEAHDGSKALLVLIDLFTSFVIAFPIQDRSAKSVAEKLWHVCSLFGLPSVLQSDNGKEFCNEVVKEMSKIMQLDLRFIAPYNPRCDGAVERAVGVLSTTIKKMMQGADIYWPLFVPAAQMHLNNKVHSVTKSTPFSLMFGRLFNLPRKSDSSLDHNTSVHKEEWTEQSWLEFQSRINSVVHPELFAKMRTTKENMVKSVDQSHRLLKPQEFPPGATVMLRDPRKKDKRDTNYVGPYTIQRRDRNGNCILVDNDGKPLDRHVPPDQLKPVATDPTTAQDAMDFTSNNIRTIKSIRDHRGDPGISFEYLVRWTDSTESWEPSTGFYDTECIRLYWKRHNKNLKKLKKRGVQIHESTDPASSDFRGGESASAPNARHQPVPSTPTTGSPSESKVSLMSDEDLTPLDPNPRSSPELKKFLSDFILSVPLTSRHLNLRKNGLGHRLQSLIWTSNLKFTYQDVVKQLKRTLHELFAE